MKILILGGTLFLGRHITEAALARGHQVSLFNRGRCNPDLFPTVEKLIGDRDGDLSALHQRKFDAVIDTSGYRPEQMQAVAAALGDAVPHYTFISSISVYRTFAPGCRFNEEAPLLEGDEGYGALKARSEASIEAAYPGKVAHVRPGLIVGPHDPTDRFTYWPRRIFQGGDVLAPGSPERPVQLIDVRDLAEWCVHLTEQRSVGRFNVAGPETNLTMAQLLAECIAVTAGNARLHWVADVDLLAEEVQPWSELPLWIPAADASFGGMLLADSRRALAAGLRIRALADTIRATRDWERNDANAQAPSPSRVTTLSAEREQALLAKYRQ